MSAAVSAPSLPADVSAQPPQREFAPATQGLTPVAGIGAATAVSLTACGGGGGADGGAGASPTDAPATPEAVAPATDAEAARFLAQAGFGATATDLAAVKSRGYARWLDDQFAAPASQSHFDWMLAKGYAVEANRFNFNGTDNTLWRKWLSSPDQLRQRVVLALSEIFVVSMSGMDVSWRGFAIAAYVDMLEQRAFGSYRELLEGVTLSNAMGVYLNMRGNKKEDGKGRVPDENFAREVMQLFSIGLHELDLDGTPKSGPDGKPRESYTLAHITDLARVFTGWDFDGASDAEPAFMRRRMVHTASRFSTGAKKVLDVDIAATADGPTALKIALDTLANHPNVGPFIGRQLIQRLVCSNPSAGYVRRVATVFNDNGRGQRGDLKAVVRAILLDAEARNPTLGPGVGRLREPVQRFIQWGRTFGVASPTELWNVGDTTNPGTRLGQSPLRSPSVFNFFRPGYVPPNSQLGANGVTAPEFQLCNESTVAGYLNFMQGAIANGVGEVKPNYQAELALVADAPALVDRIAMLLGGGNVLSTTRSQIATAVATIKADTDARKLQRVQAAVLLVMASPEYQVQK